MGKTKDPDFEKNKEKVRKILISKSKDEDSPLITYSELIKLALPKIRYANNRMLIKILTDISVEEHTKGRPLLSALVVNRAQMIPGLGFWKLAESLNEIPRDCSPENFTIYWLLEVGKIKDYPY